MKQGIPINPMVLRWARESAGYLIEQDIKRFPRLHDWEEGKVCPTYKQLEKLAQHYKRPVAIFFFPDLPKEKKIESVFRSLSTDDIEHLSPKVKWLFRKAKAYQCNLKELYDAPYQEQQSKLEWLKKYGRQNSILGLAKIIRERFKVSLSDQKQLKDNDKALDFWRAILAANGVYVFKDNFDSDRVSGFCIYDELFPIIYLNNSMSKTRQIFTIFHELAHLLLNQNHLDTKTDAFLDEKDLSKIERDCNWFAANFLVPEDDFAKETGHSRGFSEDCLKRLANIYKVSRLVILKKLLDNQSISREVYFSQCNRLEKKNFSVFKKNAGGDYYSTQFTYLGKPYSKLVFEKYYQGKIEKTKAAEYLNINVVTTNAKTGKLSKIFDNMEHIFTLRGLS